MSCTMVDLGWFDRSHFNFHENNLSGSCNSNPILSVFCNDGVAAFCLSPLEDTSVSGQYFITMVSMVRKTLPNAWNFSKSACVIQPENRFKRGAVTTQRWKICVQGEKNSWISKRVIYFIWKQSYIFPSACSCIILFYFSNYGNRTRKIQTAAHIVTTFLKKKSK